MNSKIFFSGVAVILVGGIAYWLISPAYRVVEKQEQSPVEPSTPSPVINDDFETMPESTKAQMDSQIEILKSKPMVTEMPSPATPMARVVAQGTLQPRAHEVKGNALLIEDQGKQILRFENFETINGPDVRIYLSSNLGIEDSIDLGPILATKGNVNYVLTDSIDTSKYQYVLVWCRAFRVLFSYAQLQ